MSELVANYYKSSSGKYFLIMGDKDSIGVYDRPSSTWERLNGQPYQITNLEEALGLILADENIRKQITPRPNNLHPLYVGTIEGDGEQLVMIQLIDWERFHQASQAYLK